MSTIKDVASHAGVSIATVSNYMNHTKPVSKAVSARIKAAIEELQYSQNLTAKNLKSSTYNDIGIILPNFNDSYYVQIFQGIEYAFQNSPYYLNLTFSYDIPEIEQQIVQNMLRKQVCGLILVSCQQDGWKFYYENFNKQNRPIVLIDRLISSLDANFVSFDNRTSIREMTQTLLDSDYQKIYLMTGPLRFTSESECVKGFTEAYESSDRAPHKDAIIQTDLNKEDAFRKITAYSRKTHPISS
jgi:multiple sugar transport system substrate-binding protein